MNESGASIDFTGEEMEMILAYMDAAEAVTVQAAILNAISLALDQADWLDDEIASIDDGN